MNQFFTKKNLYFFNFSLKYFNISLKLRNKLKMKAENFIVNSFSVFFKLNRSKIEEIKQFSEFLEIFFHFKSVVKFIK